MQIYLQGVKKPLEELYYELINIMRDLDNDIICNKHSCISSPYADARFCGSRPLKEYMYLRFKLHGNKQTNILGFFFDASEYRFRYGLVLYKCTNLGMNKIREFVLDHKQLCETIIDEIFSTNILKFYGEAYKKDYYYEEPKALKEILNRKSFLLVHEEPMNQILFSRDLLSQLCLAWESARDIYFFLKEALSQNPFLT